MPIVALPTYSTAYRDAVLADSPIAYWRLGETSGTAAADETGNYPGTYAGSTYTQGQATLTTNNQGDLSTRFFNSTGRVFVNGGLLPFGTGNPTSYSIEAWIFQPNVSSNVFTIFAQRFPSTGETNASFYLSTDESIRANKQPPSGGTFVGSIIDQLTPHHVVYTESGSTRTIYIDGALDVQDSGGEVFSGTTPTEATIGHSSNGAGVNSNCTIDEVALYNYPLTLPQVQAHYAAGT